MEHTHHQDNRVATQQLMTTTRTSKDRLAMSRLVPDISIIILK